jgi:hypothetical protein
VQKHRKNPKKLWQTIRGALPNESNNVNTDITPNVFNEYFASIGKKVASSIPKQTVYTDHLTPTNHKFTFSEVPVQQVIKELDLLPIQSKADIIMCDSKLLRLTSHIIAPSLTILINFSLSFAYCPLDWKRAKVTPAYKNKGDQNDKNNFRPLSVIAHVAKIMEKCVHKQLLKYLTNHNFISIDQYAYLKHHSTDLCLHRLIDNILENINEGEITGMCFLDIKKCFDTIDHTILLSKLRTYGITENENSWFQSYLTNRSQIVTLKGKVSSSCNIDIGVPQGTVLGPILFLLYVNDLSNVLSKAEVNVYADDVVIYCSDNDVPSLQHKLQGEVDNVFRWYTNNKLTLGLDKCTTMVINNDVNRSVENFEIHMANTILTQVKSMTYLGVTIDEKLKWKQHVLNVIKKGNINNARLRRVTKLLPLDTKINIHKALTEPAIDYSATVWGSFSSDIKKCIDRLEHISARTILNNYDFKNTRGADLMKELGLENFENRSKYKLATIIFKAIHGLAPIHIQNLITLKRDISSIITRHANKNSLYKPLPKKEIYKNSLSYKGPTLWNSLPHTVIESQTLPQFKREYTKHKGSI